GRDRDHGRLGLAYLVQQHCRDTARTVGLHDRGVLAPGYRADVNVIDFDNLRLSAPEMHFDLPAGGRRLLQRADGYLHTVVSGIPVYESGLATGELPGRLVRGAQRPPTG
ncbi:MAG: amidohydrolase family protein, partial [Actinomycetota bacterium]|nr:amidohydrolase family protein [Actinomycetota bacterium]